MCFVSTQIAFRYDRCMARSGQLSNLSDLHIDHYHVNAKYADDMTRIVRRRSISWVSHASDNLGTGP